MIWLLMSLPFWFSGFGLLIAAPGVFSNALPGDTEAETIMQFFTMTALALCCFFLAAWLCS